MVEITEEHLKLLARAEWEFNEMEYGAPWIDPKRPYGNSDVEENIAQILGWELFVDSDEEEHLSKEQSQKAFQLHRELVDVIKQIISEYRIKK